MEWAVTVVGLASVVVVLFCIIYIMVKAKII